MRVCSCKATACYAKKLPKSKKHEKKCEIFSADPLFFCQRAPFFRRKLASLTGSIRKSLPLCWLETMKMWQGNDWQGNNKANSSSHTISHNYSAICLTGRDSVEP